ncbi:xyloglucan galactosyltransferase KATAMARI1 [Artemisia annua]|uniref:Xyloglucan galactosyltransferase KATAMARI1 n=1 Tax=Artemisia annua TaxID=35608 RepID=A0A2U1PD26_ARTAN|nr:xyloglucan galactosyltransferase KATAMARI1 [Artemisia annua]
MRKEVIYMILRLVYAGHHLKLEIKDAFDIALKTIIHKVVKLRQDIIDDDMDEDFTEINSWKYALLEQGNYEGIHKWEPYL